MGKININSAIVAFVNFLNLNQAAISTDTETKLRYNLDTIG